MDDLVKAEFSKFGISVGSPSVELNSVELHTPNISIKSVTDSLDNVRNIIVKSAVDADLMKGSIVDSVIRQYDGKSDQFCIKKKGYELRASVVAINNLIK